jgi:rare lipoprotein A
MFKMRAKMISVGLLGTAALVPVDYAKADQLGHASWYSLPKNITANGEQMNPNELTAAHRSLPFGTRVLVENLANGRSVVVRINDRGPFIGGRIIDLSKAAAATIGMIGAGTAKVRVTTAGGGVLAALGESTAEKKDGSLLTVAARAPQKPSVEPVESVSAKMAQAAPELPKAAPKVAKAAPKSSKGKSLAVAWSAKKRDAAPIKVAALAKRSTVSGRAKARPEILAAADGIRAAARQASSRGMTLVAASALKGQDAAPIIVKVARAKPTKAKARTSARAKMLAAADGIRAAGQQASSLSSRSINVASRTPHPYAVLGATPGFMKSAPTRARRGAG